MRVVIIGRQGQISTALREQRGPETDDFVFLGRPDIDLLDVESLRGRVAALRPDVVINAAAFTGVDRAESEEDIAQTVNGVAPGRLAQGAADVGAAFIHLSTDYIFDGAKAEPYGEEDAPSPANAYGRSKLAGELAVAAANPRHVILRTAWVYAPFGANFVRTMLKLPETVEAVSVVNDQIGNPTYAPDLAEAILRVARKLHAAPSDETLNGVFNLAGRGDASWADVAEAIFAGAAVRGAPRCVVNPVATRDYPTPAKRPANSRLQCDKIDGVYGIALGDWRDALGLCLDRLIGAKI
jgi:dTDP-4-dehydrorhamnose reductase